MGRLVIEKYQKTLQDILTEPGKRHES